MYLWTQITFLLSIWSEIEDQVKVEAAEDFSKVVVPIYSPTSKIQEFYLFFTFFLLLSITIAPFLPSWLSPALPTPTSHIQS